MGVNNEYKLSEEKNRECKTEDELKSPNFKTEDRIGDRTT